MKKSKKELFISEPKNFLHRHHVAYDSDESIFIGVPSQWRENIIHNHNRVRSASLSENIDLTNAQKKFSPTPVFVKRLRIIPEKIAEKHTAQEFESLHSIDPKIYPTNPMALISNVNIMYDYKEHILFYGSKNGSKEILVLKYYTVTPLTDLSQIKTELKFLSQFQHQNIVEFVEAYFWESYILIVLKSNNDLPLSDMVDQIYNIKRTDVVKSYNSRLIAYILHSIALGLKFIHLKNYIHRDIKSDNILVSSNGTVKITDFGACVLMDGIYMASDIVGTPYWMAPEIAKKEKYSFEVDVWSLGSVLLELIDGKPLFFELTPSEVLMKLKTIENENFLPKLNPTFGPLIKPLIDCCLSIRRTTRATSSQISIHPFMNTRSTADDLRDFIMLFSSI